MAFTFHKDGRCHKCGRHTNDQCDACERYICDEHRHEAGDIISTGSSIFCNECFRQGKKQNRRLKLSPPAYFP